MSAIEIVTIVVCVLIVAGVVGLSVYRKKTGKTACGSDCSACKYHEQCARMNASKAPIQNPTQSRNENDDSAR